MLNRPLGEIHAAEHGSSFCESLMVRAQTNADFQYSLALVSTKVSEIENEGFQLIAKIALLLIRRSIIA